MLEILIAENLVFSNQTLTHSYTHRIELPCLGRIETINIRIIDYVIL